MQAKWRQLLERFAGLSARERILVLVAIFAVTYQLADLVIFKHQFEEIERINTEMARDHQTIKALGQQLRTLASEVPEDPNAVIQTRIATTRDRIAALRRDLDVATRDLISPKEMSGLLEELLLKEPELRLVKLETLDTKPLRPKPPTDSSTAAAMPMDAVPALHRHGFAIEFSGGYLATLRYLQALEALPWRFFWDAVEYEVVDYPDSVVRLQLHTLSYSEDWIGV